MFIKLLNEATKARSERENKDKQGKIEPAWRCSGLGSCMRGRLINRLAPKLGMEPTHDERTLNVFEIGNQVESWLVNTLLEHPTFKEEYELLQQVEVYDPELDLRGHLDLLAIHKTTGEYFVLEVKSKHSKSFWYMDKKGEGANIHHKMQIHSYMDILWRLGGKKSDGSVVPKAPKGIKGSIVYVSKDDMAMLEYPVLHEDQELNKMWLFDVITMKKAWDTQTVPPPTDPTAWQSKYCNYCQLGICGELTDDKVKELMELAGVDKLVTKHSPEIVEPFF